MRCEQSFNQDDDYLIKFYRGLSAAKFSNYDEGEYMFAEFPDWDPTRLHRSLLLTLFRAHLSDHDMFSRVNLGSHAQKIRDILLSGRSSLDSDYAIVLRYISSKAGGLIIGPVQERYEGVNAYRLYLPHITAIIKVDKRPFASSYRSIQLGNTATVAAMHFTKFTPSEHRVFAEMMKHHGKAVERLFAPIRRSKTD